MTASLTDNRSLLQKADLALSDLTSSGGLLQPAQAQQFLRVMIKEARLLKDIAVVPMSTPIRQVDKIRFGSRILRAGQEGVALAAADRSKPDLSKVSLVAQLFKGEVRLDNEVLEDSIERADLKNTIMQLMSAKVGTDVEEIVIKGDTASSDAFLAQFDGILKQTTSHTVDATTATTSKALWRDMLKALPQEFRRDVSKLRFYTSGNSLIDYRDSLSDRIGSVGDAALQQTADVSWTGIPVVGLPIMPENIGTGSVCTSAILTDPKNINLGVLRQIRIETDKLVSEGVMVIVVTLRADCKFSVEDAVVKATNIGLS